MLRCVLLVKLVKVQNYRAHELKNTNNSFVQKFGIPRYGHRSNWKPSNEQDFGDGGA